LTRDEAIKTTGRIACWVKNQTTGTPRERGTGAPPAHGRDGADDEILCVHAGSITRGLVASFTVRRNDLDKPISQAPPLHVRYSD
jgi:hypothetical protein